MTETLQFLGTGGVWACAFFLYLTRADMRTLAKGFANHEKRIKRLETIHEKHLSPAA